MGRVVLVLAVSGLIGGLYYGGAFEFASNAERIRETLEGLGWWGPVIYVLAFAALEPFFVPGIAFILPGALVYSLPELFLYSWLGSIGAGIVGFTFARHLGREFVEKRLPARLHRYDRRLAERGLRTVIAVRVTFFLAPPAHWLLGLSGVAFGPFVLGTAIGFAPGIALVCAVVFFAGESLGEWLGSRPADFWLLIGAIVVGGLVLHQVVFRRSSQPADPEPRSSAEPTPSEGP